jgi:hypothetical protein
MLREEKERYITNLLYMHALLCVDRGGCHGDGRRLRLRPTTAVFSLWSLVLEEAQPVG